MTAIRYPRQMHEGWHEILMPVFGNTYIMQPIAKLLATHKTTLCPPVQHVFEAFRMPPADVRVVFLGQDPYPSRNAANGIAMSAPSLTPTLRAIKKDLERCYDTPPQELDTTLASWEDQGILLLNASLSCLEGQSGVHAKVWKPFMELLISNVDMHLPSRPWVLLGSKASKFASCIKSPFVFKAVHPAALKYDSSLVFELPWKRIAELGTQVNPRAGRIDWGILPF